MIIFFISPLTRIGVLTYWNLNSNIYIYIYIFLCKIFLSHIVEPPSYTLDMSRCNITRYCTQHNNLKVKLRSHFKLTKDTHTSPPRERAMVVFCDLSGEKWPRDIGTDQATSHYLNQWWLVYWRIYASLVLNELSALKVISAEHES